MQTTSCTTIIFINAQNFLPILSMELIDTKAFDTVLTSTIVLVVLAFGIVLSDTATFLARVFS